MHKKQHQCDSHLDILPTNQGTYSSDSSVADPKPPLMPELHCPERAELLEQFWRDIYFSVRVNCLRGHTYVK